MISCSVLINVVTAWRRQHSSVPRQWSIWDSRKATFVEPAFHDTDTDILARIIADTFDMRDFLKLFPWQAERGSRPTRRHPLDDPREDVGEDVGVGVVECGLM